MSRWKLRAVQALLLAAIFVAWQVLTQPGLVPPLVWDNDLAIGAASHRQLSAADAPL